MTTRALFKDDNFNNKDNIAYDGNCRLRSPKTIP